MMKEIFRQATIFVILVGISLAGAQTHDDGSSLTEKAYRDAMRQLAESIGNLQITPQVKVQDFISENDDIQQAFDSFLRELQQVGEPVLLNGRCEVTLAVTLEQVICWLKKTRQRHRSKWIESPAQFDQIRYHTDQKLFHAVGIAWQNSGVSILPKNLWDEIPAEGKRMAETAAQANAYWNLGELIKGMKTSSHSTVRDFVAANDEIRENFDKFVKDVKFVGPPRYRPEGIVEVTAQVDIDRLVAVLAEICRLHYRGSKWRPSDFQGIRDHCSREVIRTTGSGTPPPKYLKKNPPDTFPPFPVTPPAPEWADRKERVTGSGAYSTDAANPAQAKLMAKRAATMDAQRLLTEKILGLRIDAETRVEDFVTRSDVVQGKINAFIRGGEVVTVRYQPGLVEVDMEISLRDVWKIIKEK